MICKFCGKSIPDDAVYCPECGLIIRSRYEVLSERFTPRDSLPHYSEENLKRMFERDEVERQAREHASASHVSAEPEDDEARLDRMYEQARFLERFGAEQEEAEQKALAEKAARLAAETDATEMDKIGAGNAQADVEVQNDTSAATVPDALIDSEAETQGDPGETAASDAVSPDREDETDIEISSSEADSKEPDSLESNEEKTKETAETDIEEAEAGIHAETAAESDIIEDVEVSAAANAEASTQSANDAAAVPEEDIDTEKITVQADTSVNEDHSAVSTVEAATEKLTDSETIAAVVPENVDDTAAPAEALSDLENDNAETDETVRDAEAVEAEKKTEKQAEAESEAKTSVDTALEQKESSSEAGPETAEAEINEMETDSAQDVDESADTSDEQQDMQVDDEAEVDAEGGTEPDAQVNAEKQTTKENLDAAAKTDAPEEEAEIEEVSVISIEEKRAERRNSEDENAPEEDLSREEMASDEGDAALVESEDEDEVETETADTDTDTNAATDSDEAASEEEQSDEASEPQLLGKSKYTRIIAAVLVLVAVCAVALINLPAIRLRMARSAASKAMEQSNYADAITAYKKLLSLDPTDEAAYLSLTDAYLNTDHHGDAITLLRKGMEVLPNSTALKEEMDAINPSVEFSTPGGSFSDPVTVTLVTASDSNIRYSLSSDEHQGTETDYTSPVEMNYSGTYTLKAHAVTSDGFACVENSETYVISLDPTKYHLNDWHETSEGWQYLDGSGKTTSGWLELDSKYYYLNEDGYRVTGMQTIDGDTYFFNRDGVMQTGWQESDGKRYFFDETGKMLRDVWIEDNYYVGDDGAMITNGTTPDGTYVDGNGAKSFNFAAEYAKHPNTMVLIYTKDRKDMGEYSDFPARVYHNHQGDTPTGDYFETTVHISDRAFLHYIDKKLPDALVTDAYRFLPQIGILNAKQDKNGVVTEFDFILGSQA